MDASSASEGLMGQDFRAAAAFSSLEAPSERRFEQEALPHVRDLERTAARLLGDRSRAQDVVQDVYLEAWKLFHRYEPGTNCRAWLFKIMLHKVQHHRRTWLRLRFFSASAETVESQLTYTPPILDRLTDDDMLTALDRIPADYRAVVLLVDVEEFSYKEAAGILAVPIGTVMSRLSRGRRMLRDQLAGLAQSYGFTKSVRKGQGS